MPGTPFEVAVWSALRALPYATTCSYGDVARRLGKPGAARAVGLANGRNRIAIVVPCHRVLGSDGSLTGYGGGMARKEYLIRLERDGADGRAPSAPASRRPAPPRAAQLKLFRAVSRE
jgi:O-6-methylguanine DNA methyltransferase